MLSRLEARAGSWSGESLRHCLATLVHLRRALSWHQVALAGVLLLSAALNLYRLDRLGYGNQYYAAAVLSMLQSWHTFFFVSFDPLGFVSVDKPPLGFWLQVASARLFGFSGLSLLLPEALAGVGSVAVLYALVRRAFGRVAGLLAALALALTPISVAVSRNNTIDSLLVLTVLLAAWAGLRASESGRLRWLLTSAAILGLGFEIKMLQAYLVAPAIFLTYLVAAPRPRLVRIGYLALAGVVLLVVSFAWPVAVDLTPASQRPWVDSTETNSAISLAIGHNGLERLLGRSRATSQPPGAAPAAGLTGRTPPGPSGNAGVRTPGAAGAAGSVGAGRGGVAENGVAGPLRLLNQQLAGQASWLLLLALVGLLVTAPLVWSRRRKPADCRRSQACILWGTWLATTAVFFSFAEFWHRYYLVMLAPSVAALAAIGVRGAWRAYLHGRRSSWLLPLSLVGAGAVQAHTLADYPEYARWLTPLVFGGVLAAGAALLVVRLRPGALRGRSGRTSVAILATSLGTLALLAAPAVWSAVTTMELTGVGLVFAAGPAPQTAEATTPAGPPRLVPGRPAPGGGVGPGPRSASSTQNPAAQANRGGPVGPGPAPRPDGPTGPGGTPRLNPGRPAPGGGFGPGPQSASSALIAYLEANQGDATYLVATTNANSAAPIILATGKPVLPLGGFLGSEPILTTDQLAARVRAGQVRFFLLGGDPGGPGGNGHSTWVQSNCAAVPPTDLRGGFSGLYDCGGLLGAAA
jgi:4-amino-4-deoxy-L-arabinose transferase-like glycosyltransferase